MQKKLIIALALSAFIAGISAGIVTRDQPLQLKHGTLLEPPREIAPFALRSADIPVLDNAALSGQWTLVFFGFTHCPDICPATLQLLKGVRDQLRTEVDDELLPEVLLISVDPARDDVQTLANYTSYFGDGFSGATADEPALTALTTDLGIVFMRVELGDGAYTMDHTGAVLLIDPDVNLRALFSPPFGTKAIAADLSAILGQAS